MVDNNQSITARFNNDAYQLHEKIGEGGFGQVFKACQLNTGQIVAIKFLTLNPEMDEDHKRRYIERFERETLLGSRLQHPNIVRLLDKGCCDVDLLYAVFEYVDGDTLKETLATQGALNAVESASIMIQVLDALVHAHKQGVIHRDTKPANIMLSKGGVKTHAKVLDFGIGTLVDEARQLDYKSITLTQETLGTPSYSAPEQLRGEPPTPKTDLYVWALVFIECLTGNPAVSGTSLASIFHQQLSQSNVPLPKAVVGHPVAALLRRTLNKKANERTNSAAELYHQMGQLNFSTLVGEIAEPVRPNLSVDDNTQFTMTGINTVVNSQSLSFTRLTERKQITVLCVSLAIKAVKATDIDSEVIDALQLDQKSQCEDIAIRFGAFHFGTLGGILLFYFGYPIVSDNDARLAARTALEISSELSKRNVLLKQSRGIETRVSMGLHTGMVTSLGEIVPEGETLNIAMNLAQLATFNQILCSDIVRQQLDTYSEFQAHSSNPIGIDDQPQPLFALIGERQAEAFGFLRANRRNDIFVGRQQPLATLSLMIKNVNKPGTTATRTAHIYGDAGIGKSRLLFEIRDKANGFVHNVAQCLVEHKNNALYPVLNIVKYQYALDSLTPDDGQKHLATVINECQPQLMHCLPVLCVWLGLPLPTDLPLQPHAPDVQKQMLFDILTALLTATPKDQYFQPRLFIFEDIHWADPTTIEFVRHFGASDDFLRNQQIFISTSRQPLPAPLADTAIQSIELQKLSSEETRQFVVELFESQPLSKALLAGLLTRTDGIPLFIEELVGMLKQKKLVRQINGQIDFANANDQAMLPNNLRDSLQQKLDTLVYAKETAQLAATIGRAFDYDLLVATSGHEESRVQSDLNEMIATDLVFQQRKVNSAHYLFKHALLKDAAYDSIPKNHRSQIHHHLANTLLTRFAKRAQQNPHLVADHWAQAQQPSKASQWYMTAGDKAATTFAHSDYINYYQNAVAQLQHIDASNLIGNQQKQTLAKAYQGIGEGQIASGLHEQGRLALEHALLELDDEALIKADIHYRIGRSFEAHHHHQHSLQSYQQALTQLGDIHAPAAPLASVNCWIKVNSARLNVYYWLNDVDAMLQIVDEVTPLLEKRGAIEQRAEFLYAKVTLSLRQKRYVLDEQDVSLAAQACDLLSQTDDIAAIAETKFAYAMALYFNQQIAKATELFQSALTQANVLDEVTLQSRCLVYLAISCRRQGLLEQTALYAQQALEVSQQAGMNDYVAGAKANLAWVELKRNNPQKARPLIDDSLTIWRKMAGIYPYPLQWLALLLQLDLTQQKTNKPQRNLQLTDIVKALLDEQQQCLPHSVSHPFQQALASLNGNGFSSETEQFIGQGVKAARCLNYL